MKVLIYAIADPRVKHPLHRFFYVGQTSVGLPDRIAKHLQSCKRGCPQPVYFRFRDLLKAGIRPTIHLLETTSFSERCVRERHHIARLKELGAPLLNVDRKKMKLSTLHKMRMAKLGRKASAITRRKMSEAQRRAWENPAIRAKRILPRIGHAYSQATLRRMSFAAKGRIIPPAQRRKISLSLTGKHPSEATRQKMSHAHRLAWARGAYSHRKRPLH